MLNWIGFKNDSLFTINTFRRIYNDKVNNMFLTLNSQLGKVLDCPTNNNYFSTFKLIFKRWQS